MKLRARPEDDLQWKIEGDFEAFEFDLGLHLPFFPLEDPLYFSNLGAALTHFTETVWPKFPKKQAILYRGSLDFSQFFAWSETFEKQFKEWKEGMPLSDEAHLKRLFTIEAFVYYFQMLAHKLPDELSLKLIVDPTACGTLAQVHHLLSPERFQHFTIDSGFQHDSPIGICFPPDEECTGEILSKIDLLMERLPSFRPVYEHLLTEQWDGLDQLYIFPEAVTARGLRKLQGFEAAGGKAISIGAGDRGRGI